MNRAKAIFHSRDSPLLNPRPVPEEIDDYVPLNLRDPTPVPDTHLQVKDDIFAAIAGHLEQLKAAQTSSQRMNKALQDQSESLKRKLAQMEKEHEKSKANSNVLEAKTKRELKKARQEAATAQDDAKHAKKEVESLKQEAKKLRQEAERLKQQAEIGQKLDTKMKAFQAIMDDII